MGRQRGVFLAAGVYTRDTGPVPQTPAQAAASERRRKPHTPPRSMRFADEVWDPAMEKAKRDGVTLTSVVEKFLIDYASDQDD